MFLTDVVLSGDFSNTVYRGAAGCGPFRMVMVGMNPYNHMQADEGIT